MHIGDNQGFVCDFCGNYIDYDEKIEIAYKRYAKDKNYAVSSTKSSSICAYDMCDFCSAVIEKMLQEKNKMRPSHRPLIKLNRRYDRMVKAMRKEQYGKVKS